MINAKDNLCMYRLQFKVCYSVKKNDEGFQSGSNFVCSGYDEPKIISQNFYVQCLEDDFYEVFENLKDTFLKMVSSRKDFDEIVESNFHRKKLINKSSEIVETGKAIVFRKKPYYSWR